MTVFQPLSGNLGLLCSISGWSALSRLQGSRVPLAYVGKVSSERRCRVTKEMSSVAVEHANIGEPPSHPIEQLGASVFLRELVAEHGLNRAVTLIGWAVLLGSVMKDGEPLEVGRDRLKERGYENTTVWRACRDIRKVAARLDRIYEQVTNEKKLVSGIAKLQKKMSKSVLQ